MARSRNIKPGFFSNEALGECSSYARLLFAGLWTLADREGRLEDRPKRIKVQVLPFDDVDVDPLLDELAKRSFLVRYEVGGDRYIQIVNFARHQNPHKNEQQSEIPPIPEKARSTPEKDGGTLSKNGSTPADSLFSDSLNSDSLNPHPRQVANAESKRADFQSPEVKSNDGKSTTMSTTTKSGIETAKGIAENQTTLTQDKRSPSGHTSSKPPERSEPINDPRAKSTLDEIRDVEQYLLEHWGREGRLGQAIISQILQDSREFSPRAVKEAISQAAKQGVRKYAYMKAILTNSRKEANKTSKQGSGEKVCRKCGHSWNIFASGVSVCPVCYPAQAQSVENKALGLVKALADQKSNHKQEAN